MKLVHLDFLNALDNFAAVREKVENTHVSKNSNVSLWIFRNTPETAVFNSSHSCLICNCMDLTMTLSLRIDSNC